MRTRVGQSAEEALDFSVRLHRWHKEQKGQREPSNGAPAAYLVQSASQRQTLRSRRIGGESTIGSEFSCPTGLLHPAAMKVAVIVAVALLALAQGSFGQEASEVEKLGQYIDTLKTQILSSVNAQTLQSQLEPVAAQLQEQLKSFTTSLEEQIKPMATNVQAQIQPMVQSFQDQITTFIKQLGETKTGK
ncbi:unnamed protein product [Tetraodon nigroviridis]|uniref:(spotted green pufferfish) hypothetical protein n=1 Tax=Tetraodon nigroviridis TaxID=99883 RepID=Q4SJ32_TETNG|nr:unnamed protein product [Tetraodon nigroviridis]